MKKIVCIMVMLLSVMMTFAGGILHDVSFERRIDMLNLEGESYDSVLVKFDVGDVLEDYVKVTIWNKKGKRIYRHTFRKVRCFMEEVRCFMEKDYDDNVIIVGTPQIWFLMIYKCDDGPKLCIVREREGLTNKSIVEYFLEYYRNQINRKQDKETSLIKDDKVYDVVEQMPQFPGGPSAMMQFLSSNVKYPEDAEKKGIQGRVVVSFIVERDGSISNTKVEYGVDSSLDQEIIRVVSSMPRWIPGRQKGNPVRVKYTSPFTFRLQ